MEGLFFYMIYKTKGGARMKEWYQMTEQEVLEQLQARPEGLTGTQAAQRLEECLLYTSRCV